MAKVVSGTKDAKSIRIHKAVQGVRKLRCPRDKGLVVARPDGHGGTTYQCTICGTPYAFTSI